jgi:hypothetical protein
LRTRRVTQNEITWTEVAAWIPPEVDQPLVPLYAGPTEIAISLDGNPGVNQANERRRKVNALLEKHGVRPRSTW